MKTPIAVHVSRNAGHPWDGRPGFDILEFETEDKTVCDAFVTKAAEKHWQPWLVGTSKNGKFGGALYKPSGALGPWFDSVDRPHPGFDLGVADGL